jgi:hypothetical protein
VPQLAEGDKIQQASGWRGEGKRRERTMVMDRTKVKVGRMEDAPEMEAVEGTYAERIAMVWPLTVDALGFAGSFDAESRLRRDVVHLQRP